MRAAYDQFFADSQNYFIVPRLKSELSKYYKSNEGLKWTEHWTKNDDVYVNEFFPSLSTGEELTSTNIQEPIEIEDDIQISKNI